MVKEKSDKYIVRSIRVPDKIWSLLKRISSSGYRPVNSQLIKILEDWPGLTGLFVAGTYAGSLSTISSGIKECR